MLQFYFDAHVPYALLNAVRNRGVDILTAQEDQTDELEDGPLLKRATTLNRVLVTQDNDFKKIVASALTSRTEFSGVIFIRNDSVLFLVAEDLELLAKAEDLTRFKDGIVFVPL